jgi:hypothetical protein
MPHSTQIQGGAFPGAEINCCVPAEPPAPPAPVPVGSPAVQTFGELGMPEGEAQRLQYDFIFGKLHGKLIPGYIPGIWGAGLGAFARSVIRLLGPGFFTKVGGVQFWGGSGLKTVPGASGPPAKPSGSVEEIGFPPT